MDHSAFLERIKTDPQYLTELLLDSKYQDRIAKDGFNLDTQFLNQVDIAIKKMRTYIADQIHVLETKSSVVNGLHAMNDPLVHSGNGAVDW